MLDVCLRYILSVGHINVTIYRSIPASPLCWTDVFLHNYAHYFHILPMRLCSVVNEDTYLNVSNNAGFNDLLINMFYLKKVINWVKNNVFYYDVGSLYILEH